MTAGVLTQIRTGHLLNTSRKCYYWGTEPHTHCTHCPLRPPPISVEQEAGWAPETFCTFCRSKKSLSLWL